MTGVQTCALPIYKGYLINLEHVEGVRDKCAVVKGESLLLSRPRMNAFMQDLTKYWSEVK